MPLARLTLNFRAWPQAADHGTLPECRQWCRDVERKLDTVMQPKLTELLIFGETMLLH